MYTLITADDEIDKLEALRDMFDWEGNNIQIVGEATNGQEAYDLLVKLRPDICIIDIRMPKLSGLDAIQSATEKGVKTKFIVLTGYDDFDYARKAVQLQIVEYLLKPCRYEEVLRAVQKAIFLVQEGQHQKELQVQYQQLCAKNKKLSKKHFLIQLLSGFTDSNQDVQEYIHEFSLEPLFSCYAVCTLSLIERQKETDGFLNQILLPMAESDMADIELSEVVLWKEQVVILVSLSNIASNFTEFQDLLFQMLEEGTRQCHAHCVIGISDLKYDPKQLQEACTEAMKAAGLAAFDGIHGIRYYAELNCSEKVSYASQSEKDVISAVLGESGNLTDTIESFFHHYSLSSSESKKIVQQMASTLVCSIFKVCLEHNMILNLFSKMLSDTIEEISNARTMQEIQSAVLQFASDVSKSFTGNKQISAFASVTIQYIHDNYAKKITLKLTADALHISPAYLSMLFKQQTGINFIEYLNRYRIQKAKQYLNDMDSKIYEVANKIGIQDEKYFHSLFKRYTGLTATQYRDNLICNRSQERLRK